MKFNNVTIKFSGLKWNESGFRPPLCTYRLNWAMRTSWGWWDDWDDTVLQTQDSKFEPWRSEAEHATSRSRRLPTILTFRVWDVRTELNNNWHWLLVRWKATQMSHLYWATVCGAAKHWGDIGFLKGLQLVVAIYVMVGIIMINLTFFF